MKFIGELLIFILLFVTNFRVFFVTSPKRDPIVALAPLSFFLSIFQIFAWGVDFFTVLSVVIAFLVLLSNFHAIFRYSERLYIDHYSVLMHVWAVFTTLLSLGAIVLLIMFIPLEVNHKKLNITENKYYYSGNFSEGFSQSKLFGKKSAYLYEYVKNPEIKNIHELEDISKESYISKNENQEQKEIVLFIPDKRGDTYNYRPYLQLLSAEGYTVCSADFFAQDCKWFHSIFDKKLLRRTAMVADSLLNKQKFASQREFYTYNISLECKALLNMLKEKYGQNCRIFIISDLMGNTAVYDFANQNPKNVTGYFNLDSVSEYKSAGYGCVAQTSPIVNKLLGLSRDFNFEQPKLLVEKSKQVIKF